MRFTQVWSEDAKAFVAMWLTMALVLAPVPLLAAEELELEQRLIADGVAAYEAGDYRAAASQLERARKLLPDHSSAALYLGLSYLKLDRRRQAIATWRDYLKLEPATGEEADGDLKGEIGRYLTLLQQEADEAAAKRALKRERRLGPGDPKRVAVANFKNLGSPEISPLSKGLTALLIDDLSKVPGLDVVEREKMQALVDELGLGRSGTVDRRSAPRVGKLLGAGKITTGSYLDTSDEGMEISSVVADASAAQILGKQKARGEINRFFELEKALALKILLDLGISEKTLEHDGVLSEIEKPQTQSMPALVAFSKGLDLKDQRKYSEAREQFEKALDEDEDFELARKALLLLPIGAVAIGAIILAIEAAAPSGATAATASAAGAATAGGVGVSSTALVVGGGVIAAGAVAGGAVAASGGLGGGGGGGGDGSISPGAGCGNGILDPGEACEPPFQRASQCGSNQVCGGDCRTCVSDTSCTNRCCPGQDNSCQPAGASCFCDEFCRQASDCCPDVGNACGF